MFTGWEVGSWKVGVVNFCMPEIMGDPRVNESDEQKKVASVSGELDS